MSDPIFTLEFKDVSRLVEEYKVKHRTSYIQSVVDVCVDNNIEFESLKKLLSKNIRDKIEVEASELNLLKYKIKTIDAL